ncbi:OmpA family protein [Paenibacillus andongensis]|uniref:OmpA family protein n=1 Tax=Paenibacillus andongensis TaxID=2975482 RepID=UPI0021BAF843|nr:OmpA family protein [Paenibacillus andongensis]
MSRGYRNVKRFLPHGQEEEKESFWVSYTDLMSALLIIFALVLMVMMFDTQTAYEEAKSAIDDKAEVMKQKEDAIKEKDKLIEEVLGVKSKIILELVKAFKDSELNLQVDQQTGTIRFSGGVFFGTDSSAVSDTGKAYLEKFIPQYIGILMSDQFRGQVAQIIVEGHTDTDGTYLYNLKLSQDRALSVVQQIFAPSFPNFKYKDELKQVITANGRSFAVPIYKQDGTVDADKSRRVEFKFRLKDEQLLDKLQGLMQADGK